MDQEGSSPLVHRETFWPLLHLKAVPPREAIVTVGGGVGDGREVPATRCQSRHTQDRKRSKYFHILCLPFPVPGVAPVSLAGWLFLPFSKF